MEQGKQLPISSFLVVKAPLHRAAELLDMEARLSRYILEEYMLQKALSKYVSPLEAEDGQNFVISRDVTSSWAT